MALSRSSEIVSWDEVRYHHLDEYVKKFKASQKVSPKSAAHYCSVISLTSNYYARHISPALYVAIPNIHPYFRADASKEKSLSYLTTEQIVAFLEFAQRRKANTSTGLLAVALGCFARLNQQEIVRLTVGDFEMREDCLVVHIRRSKNNNRAHSLPLVSIITPLLLAEIKGRAPGELLIRTGSAGGTDEPDSLLQPDEEPSVCLPPRNSSSVTFTRTSSRRTSCVRASSTWPYAQASGLRCETRTSAMASSQF